MAASFSILRFSHPRRRLLPLLVLSLQLYSVLSDAPPPQHNCGRDLQILSPFSYTNATPGCGMNVISCSQGITWISLFNQSFCVRSISYRERKIDIDYNPESFVQEQLCSKNPNPRKFQLAADELSHRGFRLSISTIAVWKCDCTSDFEDPGTLKEVPCGDGSLLSFEGPQIQCSQHEILAPSIPGDKYSYALNGTFSLQWGSDCDSDGSNLPGCHGEAGSMKPNNCEGERKKHKYLAIILGVVLPFVILVMCAILFLCFRNRTRKRQPQLAALFNTCSTCSSKALNQPNLESTSFYRRCRNVTIFSYEELEKATGGFSPSNELGDGGFGIVYYGVLCDGREIAVKRLFEHNFNRVEQFMNEIEILSTIKHANLVELYGCTTRNSRELLLVYEYVDNGTLGDHLNGSRASDRCLTWKLRLNIAVKTAEALAYLHQLKPPIVHRDVKTSNILLDENFHVKVSDFGMSRLFPSDVSHVSTVPQGTPGYIDPRYHQCYQLTDKSDVYSFGVVLVELISSLPAVDIMRPRDEVNLANMALNMIRNNALNEFVDSSLGFQSDYLVQKSVGDVAELAFSCLAYEMEVRPTMNEVAETLRQIQAQVQKSEKNQPSFQALLKNTVFLKSRANSPPNPVDDKQSTIPNIIV